MGSWGPGELGKQFDYLFVYVEGGHATHIPADPCQVVMTNQSLSELIISLCSTGWHLEKFVDARSMILFKRPSVQRA